MGLLFGGIWTGVSFAAEAPLVLEARRSLPEGREYLQMVLATDGSATLSVNSNRMRPTKDAKVGLFTISKHASLLTLRKLALRAAVTHPADEKTAPEPHGMQLLVGDTLIAPGSSSYQVLLDELFSAALRPAWKESDVVTVKAQPGKNAFIAVDRKGTREIPWKDCRDLPLPGAGRILRCEVSPYGSVRMEVRP